MAFTGFRIVREHPAAAAIWAAILFVISVGFGALLTTTSGAAMNQLIELQIKAGGGTNVDPAKVVAVFRQLAPFYAEVGLFCLLFYPVLFAAMNRATLRPTDSWFGYLRLGLDELRQFLLLLLYLGLALGAYMTTILAAVAVSSAASALLSAGSPQAIASIVAMVLALAIVGGICALAYFGVRLSLASAFTFATGKVNLAGSWQMTRGRFWPILGVYLLAIALAALVWSLVFALTAAGVAVVGGGPQALAALVQADMRSPAAYFSPARFVYLAFSAFSSALIWPLALAPGASIYQRLAASYGYPSGGNRSAANIVV
jgi:hypothetical protein